MLFPSRTSRRSQAFAELDDERLLHERGRLESLAGVVLQTGLAAAVAGAALAYALPSGPLLRLDILVGSFGAAVAGVLALIAYVEIPGRDLLGTVREKQKDVDEALMLLLMSVLVPLMLALVISQFESAPRRATVCTPIDQVHAVAMGRATRLVCVER